MHFTDEKAEAQKTKWIVQIYVLESKAFKFYVIAEAGDRWAPGWAVSPFMDRNSAIAESP